MLNKIIHYSLHNRLVVLCAAILLLIAKIYGQTGELISVNAGKSYIGFIEGADIDLQ